MELPPLVREAIESLYPGQNRAKQHPFTAVRIADTDGYNGSVFWRIRTTSGTPLIVKQWCPSEWFLQSNKLQRWPEEFLWTNRVTHRIQANTRISIPTRTAVRAESADWLVMADVAPELGQWKAATVARDAPFWRLTPEGPAVYADLLSGLAKLHAWWEETPQDTARLAMREALVTESDLLRAFEPLFIEWFGGSPSNDSPAVRAQKDQFTAHRRARYEAFLDTLGATDRALWMSAMLRRDALVARVQARPKTLLHGDLNWRNIGMSTEDGRRRFVLIDWETALYGLHALDVVSLLFNAVLNDEEFDSLTEHYHDQYRAANGRLLGKDEWSEAVELAVAWIAATRVPFKHRIVTATGHERDSRNMDCFVERSLRALRRLTKEH